MLTEFLDSPEGAFCNTRQIPADVGPEKTPVKNRKWFCHFSVQSQKHIFQKIM